VPELIDDKIVVALAKSGASNREIEAAIGHGIDSEERVAIDKARAVSKLRRAVKKKHPTGYEHHKEETRRREAEISKSGRDIGTIPEVFNKIRKETGRLDFRAYCEQYFPQTFTLAWSHDHLKVLAKVEDAVLRGGLYALAMPRGSGKTSIAECACLWATMYGHRDFVCLIGPDEGLAVQMLDSLKSELEGNDLLLEDFPEVCYPIARLEGIAHRANGQLCCGKRTQIGWTAKEIVLPTIPGSQASGAIVKVAGLTGCIRGLKFKRSDGKSVRPSLVVIDDPQTDESARSPSQCSYRESILAGAILGLAGPGKKISGIMPCTVIWPGDMADRILDREKHPQWQGERTKMVYSFPTDEALWDRYAEIRADGLRRGQGLERATVFYREHQAEMDAGAVVAWPQRYNHDEASAIQNAMNLRLQNAQAFSAEYQNEPIVPDQTDQILTVEQVLSKTNGHARGAVPPNATTVTMFVDLHKDVLYYAVCAWEEHFTGYVIDYGTFPDQKRPYFTLLESPYKLGDTYPGAGVDGAIGSGLEALVKDYLGRDWMCGTGRMRIDRLLVDMGYKPAVAAQVKAKVGGAVMMLSKGVGVRASRKPIIEYVRKPGETVGHYWYIPNVSRTDQFPYVLMDVNYWKRTIHDGFALPLTDRGSLSLFGTDGRRHEMLADHVARSEKWVEVTGPGGNVREWMALPTRPDNHFFDCLVGCAVAASIAGIKFAGQQVEKKARKRYTQDDLRRRV